MSEQDGTQATTLQRPLNDDIEAWKAYWRQQGQGWRTELEIDTKRQRYLAERRSIKPDIRHCIYPFKDIKLSRADVEWLLATHDNGRGPVDWSDESQREREGLDLRGADLRKVFLDGLPLARIRGGLSPQVLPSYTDEQREAAAIHFEEAYLRYAHLEGADLSYAHLGGAYLNYAHLEEAVLAYAHLEAADFNYANLREAYFNYANLGGAGLIQAQLQEASLNSAHLEWASLFRAHLEGANLSSAYVGRAEFNQVFFDSATELYKIVLSDKQLGAVSLADARWGDVNVAVVDWWAISVLGDETRAREKKGIYDYQSAVRAYRQLAVVLRNQGLNEDAARFAYRAQLIQRVVLRQQRKFGQYLFSLFLDLLAGYGYKPWRSFVAYLLVITAFATTNYAIGHTVGPDISPVGSFVFSMTSFHGRGFFPGGIALDDPLTILAAIEAFVGLLIEVTFIATLTQRLFGK